MFFVRVLVCLFCDGDKALDMIPVYVGGRRWRRITKYYKLSKDQTTQRYQWTIFPLRIRLGVPGPLHNSRSRDTENT